MNEQYLQTMSEKPEEDEGPHSPAHPADTVPSPSPAAIATAVPTPVSTTGPLTAAPVPHPLTSAATVARESSSDDSSSPSQKSESGAYRGHESPSLLIDAFLRTGEQSSSTLPAQLTEYHNPSSHGEPDPPVADSDELADYLTISLPSPGSLLNSN